MQKPLPTQRQMLQSMSIFLAGKLNQAAQDKDWERAVAISKIMKAAAECLEEVNAS